MARENVAQEQDKAANMRAPDSANFIKIYRVCYDPRHLARLA
jgi:hypothetical protein